VRNIGISAHIDSGKTTLTERILFYTGRIDEIHEVGKRDGEGAKMDSMELEREKGITIQSAATYCNWNVDDKTHHINIIDTPGHIDFTIEVERALSVLDGAVLVVCGVSGVQSQTLTVDRQMRRYNVPRVVFINKLDRDGADPPRCLNMLRNKLGLRTCPIQVPMGLESRHRGVIDVIDRKAYAFDGYKGSERTEIDVPPEFAEQVEVTRAELLETLADLDDEFAEHYLEHEAASSPEAIHAAVRRQTIQRTFSPMLMGSAYKNKGVQNLLDAVCRYLPNPTEVRNVALDQDNDEETVELSCDPKKPLVALAFKIQDLPTGQLTYMRLYQGKLQKGMSITNMTTQKKHPIKRIFRMHSNEMRPVDTAAAGDIVALGGLEVASGTTFTDGRLRYTMTTMYVPPPVMSLAIKVSTRGEMDRFSKAIGKFQREDPTFHVHTDEESKEIIMSGMGELHLEIYAERMRREYNIAVETGAPKVNFRETITTKCDYDYTHKRQSGGRGEYGKIIGYFEPIPEEDAPDDGEDSIIFESQLMGNDIPPSYIPSIEKGFRECARKGLLSGHPLINTKFVVHDGKAHEVDSSDQAFRNAAEGAFRNFYMDAGPVILEPIMAVEVTVPADQQAVAVTSITRRKGSVTNTSQRAETVTVQAEVGLKDMFGYTADIRSFTQGQGEYTMEFLCYRQMGGSEQEEVVNKYQEQRLAELKARRGR